MDPLITTALALGAFAAGSILAFIIAQRLTRSRTQAAAAANSAAIAAEKARLATEHLKQIADADTELRAKSVEALARQREALEASLARDRAAASEERTAAQRSRAEALAAEERARAREAKLAERETMLDRRRETVDTHEARLREQDEASASRLRELGERTKLVELGEQKIDTRLAEVASLTIDAAKEELFKRLDAGLAAEQSERIAKNEKDLTTRSKELGVEIISRAIQRYAAEHTAETTSAKIKLADEEMKGRIIGKEGRNIKAFEQATGVDLLLDDQQPNIITISCFSGLRREMARRTLTVLLDDGRIHPGRIEEVMAKVQQDMDREVLKLGEDAAFAVEVSGLHPQLLRLLGKLQWRTSYGQNVLQHTQEVAFLCGAMAADLGLDPKLGRRCGLMHDIGKAIDHEQEGSHPELGYEALKRFGESEIVANAALAHHEGHAVLSAYTVLAAAADAISAARPGARSKNIEGYIKRLEKLEEIATGYHGVQKAYAIQAGRELRVIVSGRDVPDTELPKLAREIAKRIEDEVTFPGEVKVTIIREMRHFAVAR